jgi:hypothetical protein
MTALSIMMPDRDGVESGGWHEYRQCQIYGKIPGTGRLTPGKIVVYYQRHVS